MKKIYLLPLLGFLILSTPFTSYAQRLYINEFMASNNSVIADPDFHTYSDWIEIYNAENYPVNIKNYSITDDFNLPRKYVFVNDIVIPPGTYILVWADDMDTLYHTNFKLSASGDRIGLYSPLSEIIDTVTFNIQFEDISEGRLPNGGSEWVKFYPASPARINNGNNIYLGKVPPPVFSIQGGFFQSAVTLSLSHPDTSINIYYTNDGHIPTTSSLLYQGPIVIDSTQVITARAFKTGLTPSSAIINSYFINFNSTLPVFSIVTPPENFFSDTSGIYVAGTNGITGNCSNDPRNWNQDWERPINLEFFDEDKSQEFNVKTGVKIYGGCSRLYDMKSLAMYFKDEYGLGRLNYRFFPESQIVSFNNFVLRSGGQDWWRTLLREGLVYNLAEEGMKMSVLQYKPTLVFINGRYWGIHDLVEKINEHYLESHYGIDPNNIDLITIAKNVSPTNGDAVAYNNMINFLTNRNIADSSNYAYIKSIVDIDDYIDYQITEIYGANGDWPGSNMKLWREKTPTGKWRWLLYDVDFTFGGNSKGWYNTNNLEMATATNGPDWPNPPWSTIMLRKLLTNTEFKNEFIQRFAVHMNTTFRPSKVVSVLDSLASLISSEIPRHKARWAKTITLGPDWEVNVQVMRDFASLRQPEMRNHIYQKFGIAGPYSLRISLNNPEWGKILTHNVEVKYNDSLHIFFDNIPLKVKAFAMPGYRFVRWEGINQSTSPEITIINNVNSTLTAVFEPVPLTVTKPVINEICYNTSSDFNCGEWIELYNPTNQQVSIGQWEISDGKSANIFTFSDSAKIDANGYLVVCRDTALFKSLHLNVKNVYGNFGFGLSNTSDKIILTSFSGETVDSLEYQNFGDWPVIENGGPTIALVNPQYDNTKGLNWKTSFPYGTPGRLNDVYAKTDEDDLAIYDFRLYDNYPNPFNPSTTIRFSVPALSKRESSIVSLKIYDMLGREVAVLFNEEKQEGTYEVNWNADNLTSGIYFYQLQSGSFISTKKMLLVK